MARVLVVDDFLPVRRVLVRVLERLGHDVESAIDGSDALEVLQRGRPDLIVSDFRMPGMNGREFYRVVRDALGDRCPAVLFVSASPVEEVVMTAGPAARVRFLQKPFDLLELEREVEALLAAGSPSSVAKA